MGKPLFTRRELNGLLALAVVLLLSVCAVALMRRPTTWSDNVPMQSEAVVEVRDSVVPDSTTDNVAAERSARKRKKSSRREAAASRQPRTSPLDRPVPDRK